MTNVLSRSALLSHGATGACSLVCAGSIAGSLARSASAATIPDADLAYARLLVGAEVLSLDFYTQAVGAKKFGLVGTKYLKRAPLRRRRPLPTSTSPTLRSRSIRRARRARPSTSARSPSSPVAIPSGSRSHLR
jgi:hypothetical protein